MSARKLSMQRILKPGHLQAIGLVAAQWNSLELNLLYVILKIANVPLATTTMLAAPAAFASWMDSLRKFAENSPEHKWKTIELLELCKAMQKLHTARNSVVHASWYAEYVGSGIINAVRKVDPQGRVQGTGVPKRGTKVFTVIQHSAAEMRAIAKKIQEIESALFLWLAMKPTASPPNNPAPRFPRPASPNLKTTPGGKPPSP